jgi:hypothetical protein
VLDPGRLLSLIAKAVLVTERALNLIDGGRYDEPQGDTQKGNEHGVMENDPYAGADPAACQPIDPGAERRGENDRAEEQRHDEPCLPDQDGRQHDPDDDERPDRHARRNARQVIAGLVLDRKEIDVTVTHLDRHGRWSPPEARVDSIPRTT